MDPVSRRELLRAGTRLAAVGGVAGLAGCNALGGAAPGNRTPYDVPERTDDPEEADGTAAGTGDGTGPDAVDFASLSVPDPARPAYRRWIPPVSRLAADGGGYRLQYARPFWVDQFAPDVPEGFNRHRQVGKAGLDYFGIGFDRYQWVVQVDALDSLRAAVVAAPHDRSTVDGTLTGTGYEPAGSHRGFDVFAREDGPRAVAVADGLLAWAASTRRDRDPSPRTAVERIVDAGTGAAPRYHEVDDGFDLLSRTVGAPLVGTLHTGDVAGQYLVWDWGLEGIAGWAWSTAFDRTNSYLRTDFAFDDSDPPEIRRDRLRSDVAGETLYRQADAVDVTATDRTATVVAAVADDRYHDLAGGGESPPGISVPQITWGYDHDADAGDLTVTHRGGEAAAATTLLVSTDAPGRERQFADEHDTVGPGDSLTVAVVPGGAVTITWISPVGNDSATVGLYAVPEEG